MLHEVEENAGINQGLISTINKLLLVIMVLVIAVVALPFVFYFNTQPLKPGTQNKQETSVTALIKSGDDVYWTAPDITAIKDAVKKEQVEYGKELVAHTARYLGPNGSVLKMSNGMNCQNCHLQAGTAVFANNYGSVASMYPKFRARSGAVENIYKRVNDCFERSLNGKELDTTSKEMDAIVSYINFVGSNVPKGTVAKGSGFKDLAWLDRAADPVKGLAVYTTKCQSCHQPNGEGLFTPDKTEFTYPALWGKNSFNDGAGLYRISNFAKYVKYNMPLGVTYQNPQLTDEEAWDVAAFVTSQTRPHMNTPKDWPDKSKKPVDHPFGPYADAFTEQQHKLGPFKPILEEQKKSNNSGKQKSTSIAKK
jgi:thiosulfate dehydrogenase